MAIKNSYTISPDEIKPGDVFVFTVTLHVMNVTHNGKVWVAAYRCPWINPKIGRDGVPQGDSIDMDCVKPIVKALAPTLFNKGIIPTED